MRVPMILFTILALMLLYSSFSDAATNLYVDYITIDGHAFVVVDKPGMHALVAVDMKDDVRMQVKAVCKVIKCNKEKD